MPTGLRWTRAAQGQIWTRRERSTGETVEIQAPVKYEADFVSGAGTAAGVLVPWVLAMTTADSSAIAPLDQGAGSDSDTQGGLRHTSGIGNASTASHAGISMSNYERFVLGATSTAKYNSFEFRVKVKKNTDMKYQNMFIGFVGGADIPAAGTGLKGTCHTICGFFIGDISGTNWLPGNVDSLGITAVLAGGDNATPSSCTFTTASAGTAVDDTYAIYRIQLNSDKTVSFFINDVQVATGTTFSLASVLAANSAVQIHVNLHRTASALTTSQSLATTDYIKAWSLR